MCYVHVPAPHVECDRCILQTWTKKKNKGRKQSVLGSRDFTWRLWSRWVLCHLLILDSDVSMGVTARSARRRLERRTVLYNTDSALWLTHSSYSPTARCEPPTGFWEKSRFLWRKSRRKKAVSGKNLVLWKENMNIPCQLISISAKKC